jgi:membrane protein DedA with SNARE-associated domain
MMAHTILAGISSFIVQTIASWSYGGVVGLMAIESANIPLPSEVIMPFAGFLVAQGEANLWLVGLAGGLGCTIGSAFSWWLGAWGGKPLVRRYGHYVLLAEHDVERGERWLRRYGHSIAFFSRLVPVVRTFISFPAGIAKVNLPLFLLYTFLGSVIWSTGLAWVGMKMGENWENLKVYFHDFDTVILLVIFLGVVWWVWRHVKKSR